MMVGSGDDSIMTTSCVGLMMKVGSISGAGAVGGRKGVGVGAGEQAGVRARYKQTSGIHLQLGKNRLLVILKKKGDRDGRPLGLLFFVCSDGCIVAYADLKRESDLAAHGFLANNSV